MVENNRHPDWNQELLLSNPPDLIDMSGYLWVQFKDKNKSSQTIEKLVIPLFAFRPFQPVHLEIQSGVPVAKANSGVRASANELAVQKSGLQASKSGGQITSDQCRFYLSLTLEKVSPIPG
jgi:hypothetical protein